MDCIFLLFLVFVALVPSPGVNALCQDTGVNCYQFREKCKSAGWQNFLKNFCQETCKFCVSNTSPPPLPPTGDPGPPPGQCGGKHSARIVGGEEAPRGSWPWQALIRGPNGFGYCGGTLVDPQWVVTASHCLSGEKPSEIHVRLGAHYRYKKEGYEQDFKIEKVIMHESYHSPRYLAHDIALLKLEKPARLTSRVSLACLPDEKFPLPIDHATKKCWVTGWGKVSEGGSLSQFLRQVSVPLVSTGRCSKSVSGLHDSMLCAGQDQGGVDSCQGDSGGPMVCEFNGRWFLEGVVSWGVGCARPQKFGVYAHVRYLKSWVLEKMNNN